MRNPIIGEDDGVKSRNGTSQLFRIKDSTYPKKHGILFKKILILKIYDNECKNG